MFLNLSKLGVGIVLVLLVIHHAIAPIKGARWNPGSWVKMALTQIGQIFTGKPLSFLGKLKKLAYVGALLCFVILFLTGFVPMWSGGHLAGYVVMLHVGLAPVFVSCVAFLAIAWAQANAFIGGATDGPNGCLFKKCCFWALLILTLPMALSIALCMLPIFGTYGQELMLEVHRYSALPFALIGMVHSYLTLRSQV
jgi:hypothetical protein